MVGTESKSARAKLFALDIIKSAYAVSSVANYGVPSEVPWPAIFRFANSESCLAMLCDCALSKHAAQLDEVASLLTLFRDRGRERNAEIARVIRETLTRLASRGVEAVVLKGGAFLASGSPSSRTMLDIDLLVMPRDKSKALETLKSAGYKVPAHDNWYEIAKSSSCPTDLRSFRRYRDRTPHATCSKRRQSSDLSRCYIR